MEDDRLPIRILVGGKILIDLLRQLNALVLIHAIRVHASAIRHRHLVEHTFAYLIGILLKKPTIRDQFLLNAFGVVKPFNGEKQPDVRRRIVTKNLKD